MNKMAETTGSEARTIAGRVWFAHFGTALTIAAGLSFLFLCMILPLVGKAGVMTVHARQNFIAFLLVLLLTCVLSIAATVAKLARRHMDQSPLPFFSFTLLGLSLLLLVALLTGLLHI